MNVKCETERRAREEFRRARPAGGFTLVELLVVLAVIAIMAGVAIPLFSRMGLFSQNELQGASREVFTMIRAARVFAATYRVDTAVVYAPYERYWGPDVPPEEPEVANALRRIGIVYRPEGKDFYVPVAEDEGGFRRLPGQTCVVLDTDEPYRIPVTFNLEPGIAQEQIVTESFPAHVFRPSGMMVNTGAELFRVYVQFTADAPESERAIETENEDGVFELRKTTIKLYRSTGRAEIARD